MSIGRNFPFPNFLDRVDDLSWAEFQPKMTTQCAELWKTIEKTQNFKKFYE